MSDDGNRHDHPPTAGEQNFLENGSETTENDQSGLPPWAAAFTAQVTAQLRASFTVQLSANQEALRAALEECSASARDARLASAQLQDQSAQLQEQSAQLQEQFRTVDQNTTRAFL
jgi:small-conductance mechanosensitive channel